MPTQYSLNKPQEFTLDKVSLYEESKEYLKSCGFHIIPNLAAPSGCHEIYELTNPPTFSGVQYPDRFKVYRKYSYESLKRLSFIINEASPTVKQFLDPLISAERTSSPLHGMAIMAGKARQSKPPENGIDLKGISCSGNYIGDSLRLTRKLLPQRSWFDPEYKTATFKNVWGLLWDDAELDAIAITIGRGLVGSNYTTNVDGELITHEFRNTPLLMGEPGLGKSSLLTRHTHRVLAECGYSLMIPHSLDRKFGMTNICRADIVMVDDVTKESYIKYLTADNFKQLISGGLVECEEKNQPTTQERSLGVFLMGLNYFSLKDVERYLDAGAKNRVLPCKTFDSTKIPLKHHLARWSSPDTAVLHSLWDCVDLFRQTEDLLGFINRVKRGLKVQIVSDLIAHFFNCLNFCLLLSGKEPVYRLDDIHWGLAIDEIIAVKKSLEFSLGQDWDESGRNSNHPFPTIESLSLQSLLSVKMLCMAEYTTGTTVIQDYPKFLVKIFEELRFDNGHIFVGRNTEIIRDQLQSSLKWLPKTKKIVERLHDRTTENT